MVFVKFVESMEKNLKSLAELKWPRLEVAVIPDNCELEILLGEKTFITNVFSPYDENIINFLSEISKKIFENPASKQYPDLISFAFFSNFFLVLSPCTDPWVI